MTDWGDEQEFMRNYRLTGAAEMAKAYGTHRQAIYNRYNYLKNYKSRLPNGRVVPKEKQFPYLEYLKLILEAIRKDAEASGMGSKIKSLGFKAWLGTKAGKRHLTSFMLAREGS